VTHAVPIDTVLCNRILAEYREMPGLRLSARQAARLWGLDVDFCEDLLDRLVASGHLARSARGDYCVRADAEWTRRSASVSSRRRVAT
jgi:hypothetical protein